MASLDTSSPINVFFVILSALVIISVVISVHEASHAFFANKLGDPTARLMGRMTLNPMAHIDPIGTILIPLILFIFGGFIFGWAKPTPINPLNFSHPRRDSAIVAFAGPASNFTLAIFFSILFRILPNQFFLFFVSINLILGIFNLIPVPPLDGYKVLLGILPREAALRLSVLENYGPIILIIFLFFFIQFFAPLISAAINILLRLLVGTTF
ncbi:MAG: site-2 protease family protein [bacterium]|nr:site-2 protease family protein [bacterium]